MPHLGDPMPSALAAYYDAIDHHRLTEAAECFTADAIYAAPRPGVAETAPRTITIGAAALRERFIERGPKPWRHDATLVVAAGPDALIEGVLHDDAGAPIASYVGERTNR